MSLESLLSSDWQSLQRILIVGTLGYAALLLFLQIAGNQSLAKRTSYGMIVTVALGSTLATTVLSTDVGILEAVLAFGLLLGLQFVLSFLASRSERVASLATTRPVLVLSRGRVLPEMLRRERLTESEVHAAVRQNGHGSLESIAAVVLEVDGSLSVIPELGASGSALADVVGVVDREGDGS